MFVQTKKREVARKTGAGSDNKSSGCRWDFIVMRIWRNTEVIFQHISRARMVASRGLGGGGGNLLPSSGSFNFELITGAT